MCLCFCTSTSHQTKPIGHKTYFFFIFRFISPIYLTSPSYLSIEVNKIAFWLFWYLFFWNWFGSLSGIKIAKFELLEAVLRSGGQEKPPNPHTHVILIVKNPSMTYFLRKKIGHASFTFPLMTLFQKYFFLLVLFSD